MTKTQFLNEDDLYEILIKENIKAYYYMKILICIMLL